MKRTKFRKRSWFEFKSVHLLVTSHPCIRTWRNYMHVKQNVMYFWLLRKVKMSPRLLVFLNGTRTPASSVKTFCLFESCVSHEALAAVFLPHLTRLWITRVLMMHMFHFVACLPCCFCSTVFNVEIKWFFLFCFWWCHLKSNLEPPTSSCTEALPPSLPLISVGLSLSFCQSLICSLLSPQHRLKNNCMMTA